MSFVFLDDQGSGEQFVFRNPKRIISAQTREDIPKAFAEIDAAIADGYWLAGALSYELGHALEDKFEPPRKAPLMHLGVFDTPDKNPPASFLYTRKKPDIKFVPSWTEDEYISRFNKVQSYLESGDCYQVNLTFPMHATSDVSPTQLYAAYRRQQPGRYGAVIALNDIKLVSFSPELFFEKRGSTLRMRPMKGTRPRGDDDATILEDMRAEPKSQAENLMIVDLLRNDLSRLSKTGSVNVPELFTLETYPTLHQMTSQVTGELREGVKWQEILSSLFPCGSVTGAPKIRAMEIIEELETRPRDFYCGSVGYISPHGDASFSVAIRTVQMQDNHLRYDVGSGVVLDSDGPDEYQECLLKAKIFEREDDAVFETFRLDADGHIPRKAYHIDRLSNAIGYDVKKEFETLLASLPKKDSRVKVEATHGRLSIKPMPLDKIKTPVRLALSRYPLGAEVQHRKTKTNLRDFYDGERARICAQTDAAEVIFINEDSFICEGSFTSIFVKLGGQLYTPPRDEGILPGVLRQALIDTGEASEKRLVLNDLKQSENIYVGNSLRGLLPAIFVDFLSH